MNQDKGNGGGFSPKHLKWIVIGVLGIAFLLLFREEISDKISGADKITLGPEGVSIETKTTTTPIGETIVSGPITSETVGLQLEQSPSFRSPSGYQINWPDDGDWQSFPEMARTWGMELVIGFRPQLGQFTPNVNVTVEPSMGLSMRDWMNFSNANMAQLGLTVQETQIDEARNSGVRIIRSNLSGAPTYQIQRIILHRGQAYIATATQLDGVNDPKLSRDLNRILNSFRVG